MDDRHLDALLKRWKARTDLIWLCNNILGLTRVSEELNGEMVRRMQQFPKPKSLEEMKEHDKWVPGKGWEYTPLIVDPSAPQAKLPDPTQFAGRKRRLLLDSRSFYKSVINITGHTIQWILNYPDITILLFQATTDQAEQFLREIRDHFRTNEKLRRLFPEYCPAKPEDWGTNDQFTMPNRTPGYIRKEPTVKAVSIEKGLAGQHVEVIKFSDIVNVENSKKKERCDDIYNMFEMSLNLLVSSIYWVDIEGTRYSENDTYGRIIDFEIQQQTIPRVWSLEHEGKRLIYLKEDEARDFAKAHAIEKVVPLDNFYMRQEDKRQYSVYINACFKVAHKNPTYDYEDMLDPNIKFLVGPDGLRVSRSPKYHPSATLELEAKKDLALFSCQKLNNPTVSSADTKFPVNDQYPRLIKRDVFRQNVRPAYYEISVDIANTVHRSSDFTAIPVAMFDSGGRCYIVEIRHGKWQEEQVADNIIELVRKYKPRRVLMEQDRGNAGVKVWLARKCQLMGIHIPYHKVPKHTKQTKEEYIGSMLRPWYISGDLRFLDDLGLPYSHMLNELKGFPKGRWDDIIDALTHFFHDKAVLGRNADRPEKSAAYWMHERDAARMKAFQRKLGIQDDLEEDQEFVPTSDSTELTGWL